jgi:outer membrane usher protein
MRVRAAALLLLCAPGLLAQPGQDQRAYLELFVNGLSRDTVLVYLRGADAPDDALVAVQDLEKGGLRALRGTREMHDGREYVSLRSLAPGIEFRFDPQGLAMHVVAQANLLDTTAIDLRPVLRPEGMVLRRDTSGFLNYSISADGNGTFTGAGEVGASLRGNLAFTGFSVLPDHRFVRGLSYVVIDDPERMRRLQLGDSIALSSALGGSALIAGVSLTREFSLDPYFIRQPLPRLSGAILTPSTLDVYVNGTLVRHEPIAPGPFEVRNLPVGSGVGQVSYVVRDAFGRTQEFASPYYSAAGVLADGIADYGYSLGFRRLRFGEESADYGPPEMLARHRVGFGDWLTAGYRFEAALQRAGGTSLLASGGPTLAMALPVGELDLDAAASADGSATGGAGALSYSVFTRRLSVGGSVRAMTARYSTLSLPASVDRPLLQFSGSIGAPVVPRLNLTLQGQMNAMRDTGLSSALTLRSDLHISNDLSVSLSGTRLRTPGETSQWLAYATLIYSFGGGTTGDVGGTAGRGVAAATAGVQKSLPLGEGWGYQLRSTIERDQATAGLGQVQYQGPYGTYLASYDRVGNANAAAATAAGALVVVDGNVMASRPVQEGFALLQVPGVEGVRGYLNNQEIGRTNGAGNLLVPSLQPYYGNRLRIGDADIPMDYQLGATEQVIATTVRGGALVRFQAQKVTSVKGLVRVDVNGRATVPAFGELTLDARTKSPLGAEGQFWFGDLSVGSHVAQVEFREGTCRFELLVPETAGAAVNLGTLSCAGGQVALEGVPQPQ